MKTTMKTTILSLASFLALGFAGVAHAGEGAARRGQVQVQGAAVKAVVAGPEFSGASVFVAAASSGTDADCTAAAGRGAGTALTADRVEVVSLGAGQIACVASTGERSIDLLWRAQPATAALIARR
jgi:hypothetical protein